MPVMCGIKIMTRSALIILALLLLPSSLSVPLPSTGPWASETQYFKAISGMAYHGILVAAYKGGGVYVY